ncbi:hypothetical protein KAT92_04295, partial [Candidatus Babeliales bacterium]|nr:hypothetical protein [Candidatus Babeliales bacterium]
MKNFKLLSFLLLAMTVSNGFDLFAVEEEDDRVQVSHTQDVLWGLGAATVAGGTTYGLLRLLFHDGGLFNNRDQNLAQIAIPLGVAGVAGVIASASLWNTTEEDGNRLEKYLAARRLFKEVVEWDISTHSTESLGSFIRENYSSSSPFTSALSDLKKQEGKIEQAIRELQNLMVLVNRSSRGQDEKIYVESKKLLKKIRNFQGQLATKKTIILCEASYEETRDLLSDVAQKIDFIIAGGQVQNINQSQEQSTIDGVSAGSDLWPMVKIVKDLQETIRTVNGMHETCLLQKTLCEQKKNDDGRYQELADQCDAIVQRIKNEFPRDLLQKKIQDIVSTEGYKQQINSHER